MDDVVTAAQADIFKALGHPLRLEIVRFLARRERSVAAIVDHTGAEPSNLSRHLAILKRTGILACRKEGLRVYYSLRLPCLVNLFGCVRQALREKLSEDRSLLKALKS